MIFSFSKQPLPAQAACTIANLFCFFAMLPFQQTSCSIDSTVDTWVFKPIMFCAFFNHRLKPCFPLYSEEVALLRECSKQNNASLRNDMKCEESVKKCKWVCFTKLARATKTKKKLVYFVFGAIQTFTDVL